MSVEKEKPDPTLNVLALVEAAMKRQDDLLAAHVHRFDDLREADLEATKMRINLEDQLRIAESKRIDANRQFDVNNVAIASQSSAEQARILASAIDTTARNNATALERVVNNMSARISVVEKVQYEGSGKQAVADPLNAAMLAEIKAMREQMLTSQGSSSGMKDVIGWIVAAILLVIAIAGFFATRN